MMKSNNAAIAAMQQMLQERCIAEPTFAIKMASTNKTFEGAVNYLCSQIQKSGLCMVDQETVLNILTHFYDEDSIEEGAPINCNIVVSKPELTEEDKAELREEAKKQFQEGEVRRIRNEARAKEINTNPKPTTHKAKETASVNQPNLFDF